MTAFRIGIAASRIAEVLNSRLENDDKATCLFMIENGQQATISGEGYLLDKFIRNGQIQGFSGIGTTPKRIHDREFRSAPYRLVKFDETFYHLNYDSRKSNFPHIFYLASLHETLVLSLHFSKYFLVF